MSEVGIKIGCWNIFRSSRRKHRNVQAQRKDELEVTQLGLRDRISDRISALPDDILCYVLSFLTLRDSVRTRLVAARWRYLCDCRSVLHFDALNVLGHETVNTATFQPSKFVKAVDQFTQVSKGWNVHGVKIHYGLGGEYTSHIDRWVRCFISMGIKDFELNTHSLYGKNETAYVLTSSLLHSRETSFLKRLSLGYCPITSTSKSTSWINHLTTLEFYHVILKKKGTEFFLSNGLSLTSLSLVHCRWSWPLNVELPSLKKLVLHGFVDEIVLNCPNLEILECRGRVDTVQCFKFSHVPLLREVNMGMMFLPDGCASIFGALTRHAPKLQALSLLVTTQVQTVPANNTISQLKRLDVHVDVATDFDLLTLTHFLNACPFLEVLHVKLCKGRYTNKSPESEYPDCSYYKLKEVNFDGFYATENEKKLVRYLLKNAVALQQMVIDEVCVYSSFGH